MANNSKNKSTVVHSHSMSLYIIYTIINILYQFHCVYLRRLRRSEIKINLQNSFYADETNRVPTP